MDSGIDSGAACCLPFLFVWPPPNLNNVSFSDFHNFCSVSRILSCLTMSPSRLPPPVPNSHLGLQGLSSAPFGFPLKFSPWPPRIHLVICKRGRLKLPLSPLDPQGWGGVCPDDIYASASCNLILGVPGSSSSALSSPLSSSVSRPSPPCSIPPPPVSPPPCFLPPASPCPPSPLPRTCASTWPEAR